jgi:DNA-binding beta-propeller fold protein YncE
MKRILTSAILLLFITTAFAQFGVKMQHPFPASGSTTVPSLKGISLDGTKLYGYNFFNYYFSSLDLPDCNNLTPLVLDTVYIGGDDFDNQGDLYCTVGANNLLYKVDFLTGTVDSLGMISGIPSYYLVGLAYDNQTGTMYCLQSYWGTSGSLYKIDLTTLAATLIGNITGMTNGEGLAFNPNDRMLYAMDFKSSQSNLLKINPATASATVVGSTTSFLNYTYGWFADLDFDDETGELIYSSYDSDSSTSSIWSINASNCSATLKGTVPNAQLVLAVNTNGKAVPVKWYYILLVFMIPAVIIVYRKLF